MLNQQITIINKLGLHTRAAAKLVAMAAKFESKIEITRNDHKIDAKSIMGVMMLAAGLGAEVEVEIEGEDEREAMDGLAALINDKFGEGQ